MNKLKTFLKLFSIISIILINHDVKSLPASSFIIIPSGINNLVYKNNRTVYRVESSDEDFTLSGTANQKIISIKTSNEKSIIMVSTGENSAPIEKNFTPYLRNTPFLNLDKESIKKTADAFKRSNHPITDVSLFVYNHISSKKIGIPLIPAASILAGRTGDCTEHSVLTISILRSLKIPARAVMGIILSENFSGNRDVFVYHMWVEAYRNGMWVIADATRPGNIHSNRYIALAYHNLMTETPIEYLRAISTIQDMKISVVR